MIVSADLHAGTKSRPLYKPIVPDTTARATLIVTDGRNLPAELARLFAPVPAEIWTRPEPLAPLAARLAEETEGLRLVAVGPEAFLWDVVRVAEAAGMGRDEIGLFLDGPALRRVQCLHCKSFLDGVTEKIVTCPGCGLTLLVRDHFSRRLGAYQGIATHGVTRGENPP